MSFRGARCVVLPPQGVDCLAAIEDKRLASFPRAQQRITRLRIDRGSATFRSPNCEHVVVLLAIKISASHLDPVVHPPFCPSQTKD